MNTQILIPRTACRSLGRAFVVLLLLLVATSSPSLSQTLPQNEACTEVEDNLSPLNPGEVLTRTMKPYQRHLFRVSLAPQQYVHVECRSERRRCCRHAARSKQDALWLKGTARMVSSGRKHFQQWRNRPALTTSIFAQISRSPPVTYELKVEGPRPGTPADEKRVDAERMLMEGRRLAQQRTAESRLSPSSNSKMRRRFFTSFAIREEGYALCLIGDEFRFRENFSEVMKYLTRRFRF